MISLTQSLTQDFQRNVKFDTLTDEDVAEFAEGTHIGLTKAAIKYADAIIFGEEEISPEVAAVITGTDKNVLGYQDEETYLDAYSDFYTEVLAGDSVLAD